MSDDGIYTWYTIANHILKNFTLMKNNVLILINLLKLIKMHFIFLLNIVKEKFDKIDITPEKLSNIDKSLKLYLYSKL